MAGAVDDRAVGLVVGRQHHGAGRGDQQAARPQPSRRRHPRIDDHVACVRLDAEQSASGRGGPDVRPRQRPRTPRPGVAKPQRGEEVQRRRLRPVVDGGDADDDLLRRRLRVLHEDVEPAAVVEDAGVEQLVLGPGPLPPLVLRHQLLVGEGPLRIAVAQAHGGVGRRVVDVDVVLLDVLSVIALERGEPEEPFLEVVVPLVPEGRREAELLEPVADAGDAVLPPAVGLGPRQGVGQVSPGVAVGRVILADGAPGAVGKVGAPAPPPVGVIGDGGEAIGLGVRSRCHDGSSGGGGAAERTRQSVASGRHGGETSPRPRPRHATA